MVFSEKFGLPMYGHTVVLSIVIISLTSLVLVVKDMRPGRVGAERGATV
jgi:hypothetical protein